MRLSAPTRIPRLRLHLALGSALGSLLAMQAQGQALPAPRLPTGNDVVRTDPDGLLSRPDVTSGNGRLNVTLNARNTVIDWRGFNIPENQTANFDAGLLVRTGDVAVLNRDVSGTVSQLLGRLTSDANVSVWVYNPAGIIVGSNANFATGSLVLTTLEPKDFEAGGRDYRLTATANAGQSAITVLNGARIRVEGGNRGLVMVAPRIDAAGRFEAVGQDVAFVTAADVTLSYANNGPLSVTLRQGTAVPGRSQYVRGTVAGNDALFALASQGAITDALLQVDAGVTTALAGTRGIVLSAGRPTTAVAGVTASATPADTRGIAALRVGGALTSTDNDGSDILAGASGGASFAGALSSRRDVTIGAGGPVEIAGAVTAGRTYAVDGRGIALGTAGTGVTQTAGSIAITSTDGDVVGRSGLALTTGGTGAVTLATAGTSAGAVLFDADSSIRAGDDRGGTLTLRVREAANAVTLGDVDARSLRGAVGIDAASNGLTLTSALVVGDVDVRDALRLSVGAIAGGVLASDAGVTLVSTAALTAGSVTARGGSAALSGSDVTLAGNVAATGTNADATVDGTGLLSLAGLSATRDVRIGGAGPAAAATIAGPIVAGRNYAVTAGTVRLGGTGAVTQRANGAVTLTGGGGGVTGTGALTLLANADGQGVEALTVAINPPAAGFAGGSITLAPGTALAGGPSQQSDVQIRSGDVAGGVTLGRVSARNLLGAVGTEAFATGVTRTGPITVGAVSLRGDLLIGGNGIDTGALAVGGGVTLDGGAGAVRVGGTVDAGTGVAMRGGSVSLEGSRLASGGSIDLLARSGGIATAGAIAISSTSGRGADFVRLQATGPEGIILAPGSSIVAGANRALRVGVFNGTAGAPLTLGNVTARSLGALAAADGDASRPAGAIVQAGSLAFGALDLVDGFAAESTGGDLSVARIAVTGAGQGIDLRAAGTLAVQNTVAASGDVTLASGTALRLATVESRDGRANVTSGGTVRLDRLAGALGASARGTSLLIDAVQGGTVSLLSSDGAATFGTIGGSRVEVSATGGALRLGSLDATGGATLAGTGDIVATGLVRANGALVVSAVREASLTGGADVGGDLAVTGASLVLGGSQVAGGGYTARATAGGISAASGLAITSDRDGAGNEALSLTSAGEVALAGVALRGGRDAGAAVAITAEGDATVGAVDAARLTIVGPGDGLRSIRTGALTLGSDVSLVAAQGVATGPIATGGGVAVDAGRGIAEVGDVTASGGVSLAGAAARFGTVRGASLAAIAATGDVTGGGITVDRAATVRAGGTVRIGGVGAGGAVALTGTTLEFGDVAGASLAADADGGGLTGGAVSVGGAATIASTGVTRVNGVQAGSGVTLSGASLLFGDVRGASVVARSSAGDLGGGAVTADNAVTVSGAGVVTLGRVASLRGPVEIESGGRMAVTRITSGGAATLTTGGTGSDILLAEGLAAVGDTRVTATGSIRAPFIRSSAGDLTIAAPRGEVSGYDPNTGIALGAGPGRAFSLTVGTAARLGDIAAGNIAITATSISAGRVDAGTASVSLTASAGDLTVTGSVTGGEVTLGASGRTSLVDVDASGALSLNAGAGLSFRDIAGASVRVASGGAIGGGAVRAGGGLDLAGASVALREVRGQDIAVRATGGDLAIAGSVTGGNATLGASGQLGLVDVAATGAVVMNAGVGLGFREVVGASIRGTAGGVVSGGAARSGGTLDLAGGSLGLREARGQTVALRATAGDLQLATLTAGGDAGLSASGTAGVTGAVQAGGAYRVTGGSVVLGGAGGPVQRAGGEVRITATRGDIGGVAGLTLASDADASAEAEPLILDAAGGIALAGTRLQARPGGGAALGLRAGRGGAVRLGSVEAGLVGGFDGTRVAGAFAHDASFGADAVTAGEMAVALSAGDITVGPGAVTGSLSLRAAAGVVTAGNLTAGTLDLAGAGVLTTGTIEVRGSATLTGGGVMLGNASAGTLAIRTAGVLGGAGGARPTLAATAGDLTVDAGTARVGAVSASANATLGGGTVDVAGRLSAARALLARAREALTLAEASAGGDLTLGAGGALTTGALDAGGALTANGAGATLGAARAGGAMRLTSTRDLSLASGTTTAGITVDAAGLATLGALSGGSAITVTAADAALSGPVRAASVGFVDKVPTTSTMRLGDGAGDDGFRLSAAEIGQVAAETLRFDAGSGAMSIGSVALAPLTGRTVDFVSTGTVRVVGALSAAGEGRALRIGAPEGANAAAIHVVATSGAGGRLLAAGNDLEFRADRIAVGLAPGFVDALGQGDAGRAQASALLGNANSALYNSQFGGGFYDPGMTTTVAARSLTVRFGDYALFQNTGLPGQQSGVVLGGTPAAPVSPALRVSTTGAPASASFALFGTVNGIGGASTALLGNPILAIDPALLATSRINGCLAGTGAGCLTTIVIQPSLQVFDFDSQDVFGISQDVAVPFAPIVGGNNEDLLSDLPELMPAPPPPVMRPTIAAPVAEPRP